MSESVKLVYGDQEFKLPLVEGSEGEKAVDISQLRAATGLITLDPGYANTGSCSSAITFMDGEQGILRYRGIPVEELAAKATFKETAYLLINGRASGYAPQARPYMRIRTTSTRTKDRAKPRDNSPRGSLKWTASPTTKYICRKTSRRCPTSF